MTCGEFHAVVVVDLRRRTRTSARDVLCHVETFHICRTRRWMKSLDSTTPRATFSIVRRTPPIAVELRLRVQVGTPVRGVHQNGVQLGNRAARVHQRGAEPSESVHIERHYTHGHLRTLGLLQDVQQLVPGDLAVGCPDAQRGLVDHRLVNDLARGPPGAAAETHPCFALLLGSIGTGEAKSPRICSSVCSSAGMCTFWNVLNSAAWCSSSAKSRYPVGTVPRYSSHQPRPFSAAMPTSASTRRGVITRVLVGQMPHALRAHPDAARLRHGDLALGDARRLGRLPRGQPRPLPELCAAPRRAAPGAR